MKFFKRTTTVIIILIASALIIGFNTQTVKGSKYSDGGIIPGDFSQLAEKVSPSVVNIRTEKTVKGGGMRFPQFQRRPFGQNDPFHEFFDRFFKGRPQKEFKRRSLGSGFIIDRKGYIVTNNHVVENADEITVALKDGKEYEAEIIGRDGYTDIALIKIKSVSNLPALNIGDSEALKVGEWVIAIGNPFGLDHTVTAGIVSAKGRVIGAGPYDDFIQTDASINPGNSGGPLINMDGEVVGINTLITATGQGIGFAIPINLARGIIDQLKDTGEVTRGWLGVSIQDLTEDLAEYYGVDQTKGALVAEVFEGDPADEAGIRPKDIIIEVNGAKVESSRDLTARIAELEVGETAKIIALRDGKRKTFKVKIAKRPATLAAYKKERRGQAEELGIRVSEIDREMANKMKIDEGRGVVVVSVKAESKAEKAGINKGDVIFEINRKEINTVNDYRDVVGEVKKGETLSFLIKRRGAGLAVVQIEK
jgi:serine protease Do